MIMSQLESGRYLRYIWGFQHNWEMGDEDANEQKGRIFPPLYKKTEDEELDRIQFFHILERLKAGIFDLRILASSIQVLVKQTQKRTGWVDHAVCPPSPY
jgi:hypothetical protein